MLRQAAFCSVNSHSQNLNARMANLPPSDIEKDLIAYKQRRRAQLGTPLELHPATRRMLQAEVARHASRPLLTSEEAAKNFVRSFVMSNQQQGLWARHRSQVLWGGGMFACLAFVLLILRNDPQQTARQNIFPDSLPAPTPVAPVEQPPMSPATSLKASDGALPEKESLARRMPLAPTSDESKVIAARASASPTAAQTMGNAMATSTQHQQAARRAESAAAQPARTVTLEPATRGQAFPNVVSPARTEMAQSQAEDRDGVRKVTDKADPNGLPALAKALKLQTPAPAGPSGDLKSGSGPTPSMTGTAGSLVPLSTEASGASLPAPSPALTGAQVSFTQRFQQLDGRSPYRQNFNSPPVPEVMKEFTFERRDDRIRIVDGDGSTYEGSVLPALIEELAASQIASGGLAASERKQSDQQAPAKGATAMTVGANYRFVASGLSRKLNQLVEFRGEWQPGRRQSSSESPALQEARHRNTGPIATQAVQFSLTDGKATTLSSQADADFLSKQTQSSTGGQITGRVVVGGRNEFELNAVSK